jgi:hypothetical protein
MTSINISFKGTTPFMKPDDLRFYMSEIQRLTEA